jgi:hypothetical protein
MRDRAMFDLAIDSKLCGCERTGLMAVQQKADWEWGSGIVGDHARLLDSPMHQ